MKTQIFIDNLKCGGCASTITRELKELIGVSEVKVNNETDSVEVETTEGYDLSLIKTKLKSLGYPEKDSVHGFEKLTTGAKSYVSCAIGRMHKEEHSPAN